MRSDHILYLTLFAIFSVMSYLYLKDRGGSHSLFENWAGLNPGNTENQFASNQMTASNVPPLAPSQTDAHTSLPDIDGRRVADPAVDSFTTIDSSTILPSNDSGNVGSLPPMLLSPDQQIGKPSPPSKISFISGGDLRAIPCVSKGDQSQFPWGFSSYEAKDIYNGGYESVGQNSTCT